jgi:hypothetical protein
VTPNISQVPKPVPENPSLTVGKRRCKKNNFNLLQILTANSWSRRKSSDEVEAGKAAARQNAGNVKLEEGQLAVAMPSNFAARADPPHAGAEFN